MTIDKLLIHRHSMAANNTPNPICHSSYLSLHYSPSSPSALAPSPSSMPIHHTPRSLATEHLPQ